MIETHWNGALLDPVQTVLRFAVTMTYNGVRPVLKLCEHVYEKAKRLTKQAVAAVEALIHRDAELPRYFVEIKPP